MIKTWPRSYIYWICNCKDEQNKDSLMIYIYTMVLTVVHSEIVVGIHIEDAILLYSFYRIGFIWGGKGQGMGSKL